MCTAAQLGGANLKIALIPQECVCALCSAPSSFRPCPERLEVEVGPYGRHGSRKIVSPACKIEMSAQKHVRPSAYTTVVAGNVFLRIRLRQVLIDKETHTQKNGKISLKCNIIPPQKHIIVPMLKIHPLLLTRSSPQHAAHLDLASSGNFFMRP